MAKPISNRDQITSEWLQSILKEDFGDVKVEVKAVEDGTKPGENFGSEMVKVNIEVTKENEDPKPLDLMVKMIPDGPFKDLFRTMGVFERECNAYKKVAPAMEEFQKKKLGKVVYKPPMPKCFFAKYTEDGMGTIVMENLKAKGFRLYPKQLGMDLEHATLALEVMAKFHALSVAMRIEDPDVPLIQQDGMKGLPFPPDHSLFGFIRHFAPTGCQKLIELLKSIPGQEDKVAIMEKLLESEDYINEFIKGFAHPTEPLAVVHGDYWNNNMLFQHDKESREPKELIMVDFQNCRYGNRAHDIGYYIYTSTTPEFRKENFDALLRVYHDAFHSQLKIFTNKEYLYSFDDLKNDMDKSAKFAFSSASMVIPMVLVKEEDTIDMKTVQNVNDFFEQHGDSLANRGNEQTIQRILGLMDEMMVKGVI